jgi:predicted neuraminidase
MKFIKEEIVNGNIPFNECHAASLVNLEGGGFMAVWFAGSKEGKNDVAIWMTRRNEGGWSAPEVITKIAYEPHWNPVLFRTNTGELDLYFKLGLKIPDWTTWVMRSNDEGQTWSKPVELVPGDNSGGRGPVKNKPITLSNGTIAAPASIERDKWEAFVDLSNDGGLNWTQSNLVPMEDIAIDDKFSGNRFGLIQPTLWESEPGNVHMLLRSNNGFIYRSDSLDFGKNWSRAYPTELPNNNSGIDLAKLEDGTLALAYNPVNGNWGTRKKLMLALSRDNGMTWGEKRIIDYTPEDETDGIKSEFSYPAVISIRNGGLAVAYTRHRKNIAFIAGSLNAILDNLSLA